MPLNKVTDLDLVHVTYATKILVVESNCKGCPYLRMFIEDDELHTTYGCVYPDDIRDFNPNIREPYLTVVEIAHNTCLFWKSQLLTPEEPEEMPHEPVIR